VSSVLLKSVAAFDDAFDDSALNKVRVAATIVNELDPEFLN